MSKSFINITEIFLKQKEILSQEPKNKWYFIILPLIIGIFCSALFYIDTKSILNILSLFLSIFIPLFISLLATMISFVMNKIKTRHNKERIPLIKETFYNICYLIPVSLILLILSLFMNMSLGHDCVLYKTIIHTPFCKNFYELSISVHFIYIFIIGILFYGGIVHLIMNILMVTKRIFRLFDKEIDLWTNTDDENNKKSTDKTRYESNNYYQDDND